MMRVTSTQVTKAIQHIADATEGAYRGQAKGSPLKESGTRFVAAAQQIVFDSTLGENRDALAFFLGVMDGYGILAGEWAEWAEVLNADAYAKHFDNGREDARQMKVFTARKKEMAERSESKIVKDARSVLHAAGHLRAEVEVSRDGSTVYVYHLGDNGGRVKGAAELLDYVNALEAAGWTGPGDYTVPMAQSQTVNHTTRVAAVPPTGAPEPRRVESSSHDGQ